MTELKLYLNKDYGGSANRFTVAINGAAIKETALNDIGTPIMTGDWMQRSIQYVIDYYNQC